MGGVDSVPANLTLQTLLYIGDQGVTEAFRGWGRTLRDWFGKTDDVVKHHQLQDITLTHLGYWTDNGAYYYYHTEKGKNYEQTLPDVMSYASRRHIPYRYVQLDSWWYPKDAVKAVTTWDAMPEIFPYGLRNLSAKLKLPMAAHNRYWSVNTTYAKQNGGQFDFFIGQRLSLPQGQEFWDWLMKNSKEWGLRLYVQNWLNVQLQGTEILQTDLTAGADWLDSMARAARDHHVKIQYCMSLSRHALHSLLWPEITQIRVTDDYLLNKDNWNIGVTSIFAAALGLAPSKDTFWTTSVQPGNPFNKSEPHPVLQSVIATLSTGPVGPGDAIHLTDTDTLMRCCAADGLILKPSRPATAIDGVSLEMGFGKGAGTSGEVWSTYTTFNDVMTFGIVLAVNVTRAYNVTPTNAQESRMYVRNSPNKVYNFSDLHPVDIGPGTGDTSLPPYFCLFYTSPVFLLGGEEVVVLREAEKWVPMSAQRVLSHRHTPTSLTLTLRGPPRERIHFAYLKNGQLFNVTAVPDSEGCATVRVFAGGESTVVASSSTATTAAAASTLVSSSSSSSSEGQQTTEATSTLRSTTGKRSSIASAFVRTFDIATDRKSCRFVPPPFTPSVTSEPPVTSDRPGSGAGSLRCSLMSLMTMVMMTMVMMMMVVVVMVGVF